MPLSLYIRFPVGVTSWLLTFPCFWQASVSWRARPPCLVAAILLSVFIDLVKYRPTGPAGFIYGSFDEHQPGHYFRMNATTGSTDFCQIIHQYFHPSPWHGFSLRGLPGCFGSSCSLGAKSRPLCHCCSGLGSKSN